MSFIEVLITIPPLDIEKWRTRDRSREQGTNKRGIECGGIGEKTRDDDDD